MPEKLNINYDVMQDEATKLMNSFNAITMQELFADNSTITVNNNCKKNLINADRVRQRYKDNLNKNMEYINTVSDAFRNLDNDKIRD